MTEEKILDLFFARSEQAIAELDTKYGAACRRLSLGILGDERDAEECVSDAYLGVWNTVPPQRPSPLLAFLLKIVRNLSLKRYRANTAQKRGSVYDAALEELSACLAGSDTVEDALSARELAGYIQRFLDTLSPENRVVFLRRYWFSDSYAEIARRTGLSEKNVSVRLSRTRGQLRRYLRERGVLV
ncbi:MAG: RNA polymerase sigma factor [Oscillospiraceae bacterium]